MLTRIISFSEGGNVASETSSGNHHHSQQQHHGPPGTKYLYVLELNHRRPVFGSGGRFRLLANGSLVIRNVGETDEGNYLCEADNGVNEPLGKVVMLKVNGTFFWCTNSIYWGHSILRFIMFFNKYMKWQSRTKQTYYILYINNMFGINVADTCHRSRVNTFYVKFWKILSIVDK